AKIIRPTRIPATRTAFAVDLEAACNARFSDARLRGRFLCRGDPLWAGVREDVTAMLFDYVLSGIVTVVIMVYLIYALINPERF
ncbi:MAG TPA: K(+)-transporting ATPase subunit F, partial [Stellaceae bacterium]|nr:K(+)-transporting ATPase subunit F [Stellaceae bacterium]